MKFNFKKFLCNFALISMLIVGNNFLSSCCAMGSEVAESKDTLAAKPDLKLETIATVFIEYSEILKCNFKYDSADFGPNASSNFREAFNRDCEHVEKNKRGVCRHFSNYLIKKLRAKGVEAYPLYIKYKNGSGYQAVLYKAGNGFFVADITSDIQAVQEGDDLRKERPWFFADEINSFIEYERVEHHANTIYYLDADLSDNSIQLNGIEAIASRMKILL